MLLMFNKLQKKQKISSNRSKLRTWPSQFLRILDFVRSSKMLILLPPELLTCTKDTNFTKLGLRFKVSVKQSKMLSSANRVSSKVSLIDDYIGHEKVWKEVDYEITRTFRAMLDARHQNRTAMLQIPYHQSPIFQVSSLTSDFSKTEFQKTENLQLSQKCIKEEVCDSP